MWLDRLGQSNSEFMDVERGPGFGYTRKHEGLETQLWRFMGACVLEWTAKGFFLILSI